MFKDVKHEMMTAVLAGSPYSNSNNKGHQKLFVISTNISTEVDKVKIFKINFLNIYCF